MNKDEVILLMCHEVCEDLHIDKVLRKNFFAYFYSWSFHSYNEVQKEINRINAEVNFFDKWKSSFKYINLKFSYEEKLQIYSRLFEIFSSKMRNKKSPLVLKEAFESLKISDSDHENIKDAFYKVHYFSKAGLRDYSNALLFSLLISYKNDGILDNEEFSRIRGLLRSITKHIPQIPIHSFDIKNVLAVNAYSQEEIEMMREEVVAAIKSDGEVNKKEVMAMKKVIKKMHLGEFHDDNWQVVSPYISLIALLADGVLTQKEEDWFLNHYEESFVVSSIEHVFWLFSILIQEPSVFKKNAKFIKRLWNETKPLYDMTNMLFLAFAKHFLRLNEKRILAVASYFKIGRSKEVCDSIDEILADKVVEEEILLIINLVLNDRYDLEKINEFLSQYYIERVFNGIKVEDSKLKYLAICHTIFADEVISTSEYKTLWDVFRSSKLSPEMLQSVIYDYSLCELKIYQMDDYYMYLRDQKY